ncbi:MAG TPA: tetratricopeptide repeat protein [Thermoanaerobaculia bacterium]|nr:tetratricopeptide repeat protein [Thermoanaerobaculia bacterium]
MKRPTITAFALIAAAAVALATYATGTPDNLPRALAAQQALVAERPADAAAWNDLGNLLVLSGMDDQALDAYERAVELAPQSAALHFNLALLLQQRDELRRSLQHYKRVVEIEPTNAWAHFQLGVIREARGEDSKAIERYSRALALDASLAFPDVNPQVIESDLLTEAMLRGYRPGPVRPQAPRVYQEPGRITGLLLADSDAAEVEGGSGQVVQSPEEALEEAAEEEAMAEGSRPSAAGQQATDTAPGAGDNRRVLRESDLDDRPVNQAAPQQRGGYRPPARNNPRGRTPTTVRTWRPTQPGQPAAGQPATAQPDDRRPTGSPIDPLSPALRERRSPVPVDSTGRLEVVLEDVQG